MPLIYRTQFDGYNYNLKCLHQPWIDIFASNLQNEFTSEFTNNLQTVWLN